MTKPIIIVLLLFSLALPVSALEIEAPQVPKSGQELMPDNTESFGEGLLELLHNVVKYVRPDLKEASKVCVSIFSAVMILSLVRVVSGNGKMVADIAASAAVAATLFINTNSMIGLGAQTVREMSDYGKLLYPVMTAAMAAQGGVTTSTALYAGTAFFDAFLGSLISKWLVPMIYLFLALAVANSALGEDLLKKMCEQIKSVMSWCLKTLLTIFTTYLSITGVVSGTTDAAALKATKVAISSVVPVVGGILSDSSEAVLVSAGLLKNAAGIYGILAILAIVLEPFLRIGIHYLLLKATSAMCGIFGSKEITSLIESFSTAMGFLLAMTGTVCLLLLISTVCFMKGVG